VGRQLDTEEIGDFDEEATFAIEDDDQKRGDTEENSAEADSEMVEK
jgi:hypothetical protein